MAVGVEVSNLREITRAIKAANDGVPGNLRKYLLPVAQEVAQAVASRVPRQSGDAAGTVTARAGQQGAGIAFGGSKAPYFPWLDFGGSVGRGHKPGKPWSGSVVRPAIAQGRYAYPTIEDKRGKIEEGAMEAVLRSATDAGFPVR